MWPHPSLFIFFFNPKLPTALSIFFSSSFCHSPSTVARFTCHSYTVKAIVAPISSYPMFLVSRATRVHQKRSLPSFGSRKLSTERHVPFAHNSLSCGSLLLVPLMSQSPCCVAPYRLESGGLLPLRFASLREALPCNSHLSTTGPSSTSIWRLDMFFTRWFHLFGVVGAVLL